MSVGELLNRDEDRPAYVQFERRAVDDKEATIKAGHHVSKDVDYALITPPYSKDLVHKKVDVWFKQQEKDVLNGRVPEKHLRMWKEQYKYWQNGQELPVDGTSVKEWNLLSPAQCKNLINAGCRTIEDLAQANDEALRRVGMGAHDLKNKAVAYLQSAKDTSPLVIQISGLQKENEVLKGSLASLQEQVTLMSRQLDAKPTYPQEVTREEYEGYETLNITKEDVIPLTPAQKYEAKFGKPPHHLMKEATILKKLQE